MSKRKRSRPRSASRPREPAASRPREPAAPPASRRAPATPHRVQARASRRAPLAEAPPAPWHPFPLVELTILGGIVLIVLGLAGVGSRTTLFVVCGFALVTLAGLELSVREHFAGYRSHSLLLAGAAAVLVDVPLYFWTRLPQEVLLVVGLATLGIVFRLLRSAFQRRTGGIGFRV